MLAFGLAFGMISASAVNTPMPMMNTVGLNNLSSVQSTPSLYSINNMAASLLTQSKFSKQANSTRHSNNNYVHFFFHYGELIGFASQNKIYFENRRN